LTCKPEVVPLRITLSAVAALAGLLLLSFAIFGQPELYLHQMRQQWSTVADGASPDQEAEALALQVAQLQQLLMQLKGQLVASQAAADQANQQLASLRQQQAAAPPVRGDSQVAVATEPAPPKPRQEAATPRIEPDDMQAVLSRLRQRPAASTQPADAPSAVEAPNPTPSPSRQRLALARAALVNGRIDDARKLLQEVQLQLVFRPVNPAGDDPPAAGQGAFNVARALGSLSSNDTGQSRRYIERAMDEMAGGNAQTVDNVPGPLPGGYAPAYPPR